MAQTGCKSCKCDSGLFNTGSDCSPLLLATRKLILVPKYASDGTRNIILYTDVLNKAYFDALINNSDKSKRWYPLPQLKNVDDNRGENIEETFEDGSKLFVQEGARLFKAWITPLAGQGAVSPQMKAAIESARCVESMVYLIDKAGNIIGSEAPDGSGLYGIEIDSQTISAMFIKATDKTGPKIELKFGFDADEKDENLRMITCDELGDADVLSLRGLLNVCVIATDIEDDGFKAKLVTDFGTPINPGLVKGLIQTDFAIKNVTDNSSITITSFTESPEGTYEFGFASQDPGDVLQLIPTKAGFDFQCVKDAEIEVPNS